MRIAVCFNGHIRTGIENSVNLKRFIGYLLPYCDFFFHTWSISEQKRYTNVHKDISKYTYEVNNDIVNKLTELYNIKKIGIENYKEILTKESINDFNIPMLGHIPPLMYSFMKSIEYKSQYEKNNNFKYDYVVKLRPDIFFKPDRKLSHIFDLYDFQNSNEFFIENIQQDWDINSIWCDDVLYISNSKTMDIASKLYESKKKEIMLVHPHHGYGGAGFLRYLLLNGIKICDISLAQKGYSIYREECFKYSPVTEFEKCILCDSYFYGTVGGGLALGYAYNSYYQSLENDKNNSKKLI
jgi:hypothetical protein